jgi:hypothetical protein
LNQIVEVHQQNAGEKNQEMNLTPTRDQPPGSASTSESRGGLKLKIVRDEVWFSSGCGQESSALLRRWMKGTAAGYLYVPQGEEKRADRFSRTMKK